MANYEIRYLIAGTEMDREEAESFADEVRDEVDSNHVLHRSVDEFEQGEGERLELLEVIPRSDNEIKTMQSIKKLMEQDS